jgi:hypothetical protein
MTAAWTVSTIRIQEARGAARAGSGRVCRNWATSSQLMATGTLTYTSSHPQVPTRVMSCGL